MLFSSVQANSELGKPCWSVVQWEEFREMLCIFYVGAAQNLFIEPV